MFYNNVTFTNKMMKLSSDTREGLASPISILRHAPDEPLGTKARAAQEGRGGGGVTAHPWRTQPKLGNIIRISVLC
jgi:hypothetical protein